MATNAIRGTVPAASAMASHRRCVNILTQHLTAHLGPPCSSAPKTVEYVAGEALEETELRRAEAECLLRGTSYSHMH